ncbi:MAG: pirin family protein [Dermatophilaceae bacterium]
MSNQERRPAEVLCRPERQTSGRPEVLTPRSVPLGGPRAMTVRRTLPQRARSLIGAWCFIDHYGPDDVALSGGMQVPGHPHTGLQTVSWLFTGEVEHRDTTGIHAIVRPGELNLMTAGSGIAHSEFSTSATTVLHGVQLWVALPEAHRAVAAGFEHYAPPVLDVEGARVLVFLGSLFGHTSPVPTYTSLVGAEVTLEPGQRLGVAVDPSHEHGVLVDSGSITVDGVPARRSDLVHLGEGRDEIVLEAPLGEPVRLLLLGGPPFGEQIVMWWNFIGRSHDEIADFRAQWQRERADRSLGGAGRYGPFPAAWPDTLPAPKLPNLRLRPRG